ncbi:MAG TPA: hypothetical protein PK858_02440, partial [Saprospiraceae bacterium]|nr:hypothetical protein [Saprospiraceae bacterium]
LPRWRDAAACAAVFLLGAISSTNLVKGNLRTTPLRVDVSDVVPQIQILVRRWLAGESPYQPIEFGHPYEFFPAYLPAHWMPFSLFEGWGTDYRLGATYLLWAMLAGAMWSLVRAPISLMRKVLWSAAAFLVFDLFALTSGFMFAIAVEQLIMGYYLLLMVGLTERWGLAAMAAALLLCLLSRFSLVFWVPLWLLALWWCGQGRRAGQMTLALAAGLLLLYGLPFVWQDPAMLWKGQQTYQSATLIEWGDVAAQRPHLSGGRGFAVYFWEMTRLPVAARLRALQWTAGGLSLLAAAALLGGYRRRRASLPVEDFAVGSLKIMLSVFYAFVQIPYDYLYLVPAGATLGLLYWAVRRV